MTVVHASYSNQRQVVQSCFIPIYIYQFAFRTRVQGHETKFNASDKIYTTYTHITVEFLPFTLMKGVAVFFLYSFTSVQNAFLGLLS